MSKEMIVGACHFAEENKRLKKLNEEYRTTMNKLVNKDMKINAENNKLRETLEKYVVGGFGEALAVEKIVAEMQMKSMSGIAAMSSPCAEFIKLSDAVQIVKGGVK